MSPECKALYRTYFHLYNSTTTILGLWEWWDKDEENQGWFLYDFIKKYKAK